MMTRSVQGGLLPPFDRLSFNISSTNKPESIPANSNVQFRNLHRHLQRTALSTQRYPTVHSVAITENSEYCSYGLAQSKIEHVQQLLSLLNATHVRCFDCKQIHGHILKLGALKWNHLIGNRLAMLYLKSSEDGSLDDARRVFDEMPEGTLPLYAALVGSCSRASRWEELFSVLELMVHDGFLPNKYLIPTVLKACAALQFLRTGRMVHGYAVRKELGTDAFVVNALIDMYANCGDLRSSRTVFDVMKERDVVSWTALVSAYMDRGLLHEAEEMFNSMQVNPDLISWNALISGFARHGEIQRAIFYLEALQEQGLMPRVNSWNGVISGCVQNGYFQEALDLLSKMLWFPERPNGVTIACILPACAGLNDVRIGKAIHGYAIKNDLYGNIHVQGSVIDMYSKCGRCDSAEKVFFGVKDKNNAVWNEMIAAYANEGKMEAAFGLLISMQRDGLQPDEITYNTLLAAHARRGKKNEAYALVDEMSQMDFKLNIISFNILVSGFQQSGLGNEALKLFRVMQSPSNHCFSDGLPDVSIQPNSVTTTGALAACSDQNLLWQGKEIHGYVVKNKFESNIFVSSALVDMYAKCHDLGSANKAFWKIENKNTVAWNSIIAGHTNNSQPEKAFNLFCEMLCEDTQPSSITFMILLPACGDMTALKLGRELHCFMIKKDFNELKDKLASALIDMYAKCNCIADAKLVFDCTIGKDVDSWNAVISAYSSHQNDQECSSVA